MADHVSGNLEQWRNRFEADLYDGKRRFFVAQAQDDIVGFGHSVLHTRPDGADPQASPTGYFLSGLLVAPNHRRDGIGTLLTIARLNALRDLTNVVYFLAEPENTATIELHMRLGFVGVRNVNRDGVSHILFRLDTN
ncbi:MAG TPA: GNAT family N-acetyltransferase [Acidimicrobiales bacterium]|nr:GNAT family N-acetyltransferase [Acidimicrobiales bacterium]